MSNAAGLLGAAAGHMFTKGHFKVPAALAGAAISHVATGATIRSLAAQHNSDYVTAFNANPEFRNKVKEQVSGKVQHSVGVSALKKEVKDDLKKQAELNLLDKYKASAGYQEPGSAAMAGAASTGLFAGGAGLAATKWLGKQVQLTGAKHSLANEGNSAIQAKAKNLVQFGGKLGKAALPVGAALGALGAYAGHKAYKAHAHSRNEELNFKALTNPEFRARLEQSPNHPLSHPATSGVLNAGVDALSGNPVAAAVNYVGGAAAGTKSYEFNKAQIEELRKVAYLLPLAKKLGTKIAPTAGTASLKAQTTALKTSAMSMPKSPMLKQASAKDYLVSAAKGVGSMASDAGKSFGRSFSGQEVRGIVAKHKDIPLHPDKVSLSQRFSKRHDIDKLYEMDDNKLRAAVKGTPHEAALEKAIQRRTGARVLAGAAGVAGLAKLNEPTKQEQNQNVYY